MGGELILRAPEANMLRVYPVYSVLRSYEDPCKTEVGEEVTVEEMRVLNDRSSIESLFGKQWGHTEVS